MDERGPRWRSVYHRFGSRNDALAAAGSGTREPASEVPEAELLAELHHLAAVGRPRAPPAGVPPHRRCSSTLLRPYPSTLFRHPHAWGTAAAADSLINTPESLISARGIIYIPYRSRYRPLRGGCYHILRPPERPIAPFSRRVSRRTTAPGRTSVKHKTYTRFGSWVECTPTQSTAVGPSTHVGFGGDPRWTTRQGDSTLAVLAWVRSIIHPGWMETPRRNRAT